MNNEYVKKNVNIIKSIIIYSFIFTILEAVYFIYNLADGIIIPHMSVISTLIGIHLGINIIGICISYKIRKL